MKKYIIVGICLVFIGGLFSSCSDKLDVMPPNNLTEDQIREILEGDDEEAIALILASLAENLDADFRLNSSFSGYSGNSLNPLQNQDLFNNLRGNDIVLGESTLGSSGYYQLFYNIDNSFHPWDSQAREYNYTWWKLAATPHTDANKVLKYLTKETVDAATSLAVKDYRARGLAVRAYGYMMLMERYQPAYLHGGQGGKGMPIYTEYKVNDPAVPASADDTYQFIKDDLNEAVSLFAQSEIGENGDGYTIEKTRDIDRAVVQFLLARVSLWTGDYATCISSCNEILSHYQNLIAEDAYGVKNDSVRNLADNATNAFAADNAFACLKKNPECIMGWVDGDGAQNYQFSNFNCFGEGGGGLSQYFMRIDDRLYDLIAADDYRKDIFMADTVTYMYLTDSIYRIIPEYTNTKWAATIALTQSKRNNKLNSDFCYYRSSEVLLMKAEAQAASGDDSGAKATLNTLLAARTKSGATTLTCDNYPSMAGMSAMEMVQLQWRIEMWGENGNEWSNNKRWNKNVDRSGSSVHWSSGTSYSVDHMTYEIPIQETSTNGNWNN